jgi:HTH-type transcriptional regulator, competence development regulator
MGKKAENPTLGKYLKNAREAKKLSLRAVENVTGISNPYLSQLESDKIRQPSPVWLHKLSELYEVAYETLMDLTGYPVPNSSADTASYAGLAARVGPITKSEENEVAEYLEFRRSKRKPGGRR